MDYFKTNKEAWEEAFGKHRIGWEKEPVSNKLKKDFAFLNQDLVSELKTIKLENKNIAQFCCNNGRELLSIVKSGAESGTGFDIAENFINEANRIATLNSINFNFICINILNIGNEYKEKFDLVFCSIGTLCWFKNLSNFFKTVNFVLKPNGIILINETHPILNIFSMEGEDEYDKNQPEKITYSYFKNDPWIENDGIDYVGNTKYKSKTFTSFSHTFSEIINTMVDSRIQIEKVNEYNYSLDNFALLDKGKIPLSMIITGKKIAT
jgi:SAM-dependent methyltransferase